MDNSVGIQYDKQVKLALQLALHNIARKIGISLNYCFHYGSTPELRDFRLPFPIRACVITVTVRVGTDVDKSVGVVAGA